MLMLMGRAGAIVVIAPFADMDALSPFQCFIDDEFKAAACLYKRLDEHAE